MSAKQIKDVMSFARTARIKTVAHQNQRYGASCNILLDKELCG